MKKNTKILDKLLGNKQFMMLFSLVVACLFWFVVVANISPNATITIRGVPVTVDESTGFLSKAGLHVIDESKSKINIEVSGPRYLIGTLRASDFTVTPNVGSVTKNGSFLLKLDPAMKNPKPQVKIEKISDSSVWVTFDTIISRSIQVEVKKAYNSGSVADGYIMVGTTVSPGRIELTGPSSEVDKVARVISTFQLKNNSKGIINQKSVISLYDSKNKLLSLKDTLKHTTIDNKSATVTVSILKTKQVPLTVDFANVPAGFDLNNIKTTINPANITVAGDDKDINNLTSMKLGSIDFSTLDLINTLNDDIVPQEGITDVDNVSSANVAVSLMSTGKKTLNTKNFKVINIPKGYGVKVSTYQISNINVFGPSAGIGSLSSVTATVDMSGVNVVVGTYEVPVGISVPGNTGYWVTGSYNATISVWKK